MRLTEVSGSRAREQGALKLAVPRGALLEGTLDLLDRIGVETAEVRGESRSLVFAAGGLILVTMRPSDVPTYVEAGAADLGITGKDVLLEQSDRAVYELLDLHYGACRMVLAGRKGDESLGEAERRLGSIRIATKYPRIATRYFESTGRQAEVVGVKGSVELAPLVGLADGIVDLVDTGRTLEENALEIREEIARCTARLVANRVAHKLRAAELDALAERIKGSVSPVRAEWVQWDGRDAPELAARLRSLTPPLSEVTADVERIVERVQQGGDAALREISAGFGEEPPTSLAVDPEAIEAAPGLLEPEVREALRLAAENIQAVARAELEARARPAALELPQGQTVEVREEPIAAAGVYAPGGRAAYPSSVLMCAIPARVAGAARVAVASPPGAAGRPSATVLAACSIAGVREVYAAGGAQAIAALAFGTESIDRVDLVAGPGNRYVQEAKRLVSSAVGIDGIAGPSELMVVADGTANPEWIALDLCAQGEHGEDSPLIAASPDPALLERVAELIDGMVVERPSVAQAPLALVATTGVEAALSLADAVAPEHLELAFEGADAIAARGRVAGCVFVGAGGATAFGDYAAGSNHVLPTGGAARFGGPLGPGTFRRRTSVVTIPPSAATALAPYVAVLAGAEGFPVHGESAEARAGS